jgi:hypothetical protein
MIDTGSRHDPTSSFFLAQRRNEVHPSADLKGPDRLVVLVFDEQLAAEEGRERRIRICGRTGQVAAYYRSGFDDVIIGRIPHRGFLPSAEAFFNV